MPEPTDTNQKVDHVEKTLWALDEASGAEASVRASVLAQIAIAERLDEIARHLYYIREGGGR